MTQPLRLKAETDEDLTVISSVLQDAILKVGDIRRDLNARAVTLRVTRFAHEGLPKSKAGRRVQAGLRIDSVMSAQAKGVDRSDPEAMMVLLAVQFDASDDAPSGTLSLIFAGDGTLKLDVECIDLTLADISESRNTTKVPLHPDM